MEEKEDEKYRVVNINFFKKVWYSITKFEKYPEMATEGLGRALKYLAMMCAFITVFMTISSFIEMKKVVFNLSEYIEQNIPEFSYEDGQIQMDTEEPIIIDNIQYDGINRIIINPLLESDEEKEKFEAELNKYQEGAKYVKHNRLLMLKILGTTLIQFLTYYSVTYWTYRALGFSQYNILRLTSLQAVLYATVSGIPSPGAVGVTEGAFTEIFRNIYPENIMSSAVLLNRGINFYLLVLVSGIITIISHMNSEKIENQEEK